MTPGFVSAHLFFHGSEGDGSRMKPRPVSSDPPTRSLSAAWLTPQHPLGLAQSSPCLESSGSCSEPVPHKLILSQSLRCCFLPFLFSRNCIHLFLAALHLPCRAGFSADAVSAGCSLVVVCGPLTGVASSVAAAGLSSCGSWPCGIFPDQG